MIDSAASEPTSPPAESPPRKDNHVAPWQDCHVEPRSAFKQLPRILLIRVLQEVGVEVKIVRVTVKHVLLLCPDHTITRNNNSQLWLTKSLTKPFINLLFDAETTFLMETRGRHTSKHGYESPQHMNSPTLSASFWTATFTFSIVCVYLK